MSQDEQDKLMSAIYGFYGRPKNIYQVKIRLYDGWNSGNVQRGRVFIYHLVPCPEMGPDKVNIESYFLKVTKQTCRVYKGNCNGEPDLVVCL